jgi:hypothetical protein
MVGVQLDNICPCEIALAVREAALNAPTPTSLTFSEAQGTHSKVPGSWM